MAIKINPVTVKTGKVRFAYVNFNEFQTDTTGKETDKYGCMLLIPKSDEETCKALFEARDQVIAEYKKQAGKAKLPDGFKMLIRDGDDTDKDGDYYEGHWFLNCSTKVKPVVVGRMRDEAGKLMPVKPEEVYSGMYGRCSLNIFFFSGTGTGVGAGLNGVQKLAEGERMSGGNFNAETTFADDFEDDDL